MSEDKERLLYSNGVFPKHVRDAMDSINKELEDFRHTNNMLARLMKDEPQEEVDKKESSMPCNGLNPPTPYFYCDTLKKLVLSTLKHKDWTINDVKFSDKGNLESINIKFSSEFTLGNSNNPWDPR